MNDVQQRLASLKTRLEKAKIEKAKAETNLEQLTKQQEQLLLEMSEHGVTPESVDGELASIQQKMLDDLALAESLIPVF